jgi:transcriptional regulator with XRE-family HTH domain
MIVQARRRAGLSQRELAFRLGKRQSEIARWERGHVVPSLERLREVVAACGLELTVGLAAADDSYVAAIAAALQLPAGERLARRLAAAERGRGARALAAGATPPAALDVLDVLGALAQANVAYVLVGEIAEVLHGSPLLPTAGVITIVARAGERSRLERALDAMRASPMGDPPERGVDAPERWQVPTHGLELVIAPAPAGTHGYDDLRRHAGQSWLGENLKVLVASLVSRVAEASPEDHDRARVPALRATLELASISSARCRSSLSSTATRSWRCSAPSGCLRRDRQLRGALRGVDLATEDVDITPATTAENLERLARALADLGAAIRVPAEPPVPLPADPRLLAKAEIWNLTTRYGNLDITTRPSGTHGYDDLHRNADPRFVTTGLRIEVATAPGRHSQQDRPGRWRGRMPSGPLQRPPGAPRLPLNF